MRDPPLRLLQSSPVASSRHRVLTPLVELSHYKSSVYADRTVVERERGKETVVLSAVDETKLSKTDRAYRMASTTSQVAPDQVSTKCDSDPEKPAKAGPMPAEEGQFCVCGRPFLFGEIMFKCEGYCGNWYHPKCLGMIAQEVKKLRAKKERWYCDECLQHAYRIMLFCRVLTSHHKKPPLCIYK